MVLALRREGSHPFFIPLRCAVGLLLPRAEVGGPGPSLSARWVPFNEFFLPPSWEPPQTPASSPGMFPGWPFQKDNRGTHRLATAAVRAADSPLPLRSRIHTLSCENLAIRVGLGNHCSGAAASLVGSQSFLAPRPPPGSQRWGPEEATCVNTDLQRAQLYPIPLLQSLEGTTKAQKGE